METYRIIRMYQRPDLDSHPVHGLTGLTLEEAQAHCQDPETSSRTCTSAEGVARTQACGAWFDGYEEEN